MRDISFLTERTHAHNTHPAPGTGFISGPHLWMLQNTWKGLNRQTPSTSGEDIIQERSNLQTTSPQSWTLTTHINGTCDKTLTCVLQATWQVLKPCEVLSEFYSKALALETQECINLRQLFVITWHYQKDCFFIAMFWPPFLNPKTHTARWGMYQLDVQTDGRRRPLCYMWLTYQLENKSGEREDSRMTCKFVFYIRWGKQRRGFWELMIQVMSLLEHWGRNTSQLEWNCKE